MPANDPDGAVLRENLKRTLPALLPLCSTSNGIGVSISSSLSRVSSFRSMSISPRVSSVMVSLSMTLTCITLSKSCFCVNVSTSSKTTEPPALSRYTVFLFSFPISRETYGSVRSMKPAVSLNPSILCTVTCSSPENEPGGVIRENLSSNRPATVPSLLIISKGTGFSLSEFSLSSSIFKLIRLPPRKSSDMVSLS